MKASLTVLAALAWLASASLWWWAARQPPPSLPAPSFDMDEHAYEPYDAALRGAARRNTYAAVAAMVAALLQAVASVVQ